MWDALATSGRTRSIEQQVLGFDISMGDALLMNEFLQASGCVEDEGVSARAAALGRREDRDQQEMVTYDPCHELIEEEVGAVVVDSLIRHCG